MWSVPREWSNETAFLIGGGPSLLGFDFEALAGRKCIAINNSWEKIPEADILYFCDKAWWEKKPPKSDHLATVYETNSEAAKAQFRGKYVVSLCDSSDPFVKRLRNAGRNGKLSDNPSSLAHGSNSGYQALNLAVLLGATRIVLLGIDMKVDGARTHWHQGHGQDAHTIAHRMKTMAGYFPRLLEPLRRAGVEVINCSMDSALTCFPKVPLAEILG